LFRKVTRELRRELEILSILLEFLHADITILVIVHPEELLVGIHLTLYPPEEALEFQHIYGVTLVGVELVEERAHAV